MGGHGSLASVCHLLMLYDPFFAEKISDPFLPGIPWLLETILHLYYHNNPNIVSLKKTVLPVRGGVTIKKSIKTCGQSPKGGSDASPSFYSEFLVVVEDLNQKCAEGHFRLIPLVPTKVWGGPKLQTKSQVVSTFFSDWRKAVYLWTLVPACPDLPPWLYRQHWGNFFLLA